MQVFPQSLVPGMCLRRRNKLYCCCCWTNIKNGFFIFGQKGKGRFWAKVVIRIQFPGFKNSGIKVIRIPKTTSSAPETRLNQLKKPQQAYRFDGVYDGVGQGPGVADTRHTTVPDGIEAKGCQSRRHSALPQIICDDPRARGQTRLDVRRNGQAGFHGVFGQEPYGQKKNCLIVYFFFDRTYYTIYYIGTIKKFL